MSWLARLLNRRALELDLDRELRFHVDAATDDYVRAGLSRDEARRRALIDLGGYERVKEDARDARGTRWVEDWWADTRYALRAMARSPGFSAAAALTLALGLGANTALWSISDALMRRALPIDRPDELHAIRMVGIESEDDESYRTSHPFMQRLQAAVGDSVRIAATSGFSRLYATIGDRPEAVIAQLVSGSFFPLLGVRAQRGRLIGPDDDRTLGGGPVAVITDAFWERQFGRDPSVVGRTFRVNGVPLTVVGVAEPEFTSITVGQQVDLYAPLVMQHELRYMANASSTGADMKKPWVPQNGIAWLTLVTRVAPAAVPQLAARLDGVFRAELAERLADADPAVRARGLRAHLALEPMPRGFSPLRAAFADPLRALTAGVALVLLVACANLAGLLLARSEARAHEIALRASLGARPGRLVRQVVTESLTLAMVGGALGLVLAQWAIRALLKLASSGPRAIPLDAALDGRTLLFAVGVTLAAGLLFGLAPAARVARADLYASFKAGGRVASGAGSHRVPLGRALVASQIALSLTLVAAAGVFVRTFRNLLAVDAGYARETVVAARLDIRAAGYTYEQLPALYARLLDAARAIPGVQSASLSLHGLAAGGRRTSGFVVPARTDSPGERPAQENFVTPDYFRTVGMTLVSGRAFTERDTKDAPKVAVITQAAARRLFGTDSAVGGRFGYDTPADVEVVGVLRDVRPNSLREPPPPMVLRPLAQAPQEYVTSVEVRAAGSPEPVIKALSNALASTAREIPVRDVTTLEDLLQRGLSRERLVARLAGGFGALALLLAAIGLYGVISYSVTRRRREMGVRLALGASPGQVVRLVLRESLATIAAGLALGIALWFPLLGLARRLLYGVSPHDPGTLAGGAAALLAAGVLAALLPALRAARVDPIEAIRAE
ncbi:MAG: ADOP family duplicated permease [Gemmatimonadaceae bacterium]